MLVVIFLGLLLFGAFGFMLLENQSFAQGLQNTFLSLALMYSTEDPAVRYLQVFLGLFGVIVTWWILWSAFDILFNEGYYEYLTVQSLFARLKKMKHHYIIAGGGRVGEEIALRLAHKNIPYVIIEHDMKRVKDMRRAKKPVIHGDATDAEMLHKAHLTGAKGLILTLPQAEKNLLIALLAKEHNPAIVIHARADTEDYVSVLRKAGVSIVVVPEIAAVDMLLKHVD